MKVEVTIQCSKFGACFEAKGSKYGLLMSYHMNSFCVALLKTLDVFGWDRVKVYKVGR